jgi:DNA replication and repair protein RecF
MLYVNYLHANGFRNFTDLRAEFSRGVNIIHGGNAQGKTNLLEAVFYCATGRTIRASSERELVNFDNTEACVNLNFTRNDAFNEINAVIKTQPRGAKLFSVNHVPVKRVGDILGRMLVVMFMPDDLKLIKAGPSERRTFIDTEICQLSPVYTNELREYHRALKQRNHLLKSKGDYGSLFIWDEQLAKHGKRIMRARAEFIKEINNTARDIHSRITAGEELTLEYQPNVLKPELYLDILNKSHNKDIIVGSTTSGIHKDELQFLINGIPARNFGSQGQQRTAALSAKLAEIEIIKANTGLYPVLLLDDVLSELDENRQRFLLDQIGPLQVILTCTGVEDIIRNGVSDCRVMKMEKGKITVV